MLFASGWVGEERRYTPGGAREGVNLPIPLPFQPPTQIHRGWENRGTQVCTGLKEFTETRVPPLRYLFILCVCVCDKPECTSMRFIVDVSIDYLIEFQ